MKKILFFCLICSAGITTAQNLTEKDRQFVMEAAQQGMLEIKAAQLTIDKASSQNVKDLGQRIIVDHTKATSELKALALSKNISYPTELNAEYQKCYNDLSLKSGADFDKAYTRIMVKDHEKLVARYKEENLKNSDTDIRNWASVTLPILEHDLMISQDADLVVNK